ncbi:hypothetical protein [Mycobacterium sp. AZCC_0083]|uniref:hypothetical protein n=1 Tax=Mycobacterium sp. AZCC_0083 TaxID=2735882 RepID=UPI00161315A8|nr:hypothetical protein [Mycobacterium sp. AZCC_0083]MBB5167967.1 hypothetical protein [Mycobacterium sp. AZCC_0083]
MIRTVSCLTSFGIAAAGVGALLLTHSGLFTANPEPRVVPEVQPAAFSFAQIYPWVVAPGPATSTAGAAALSANALTAAGGALQVAAKGALQTVNQLGPLAFDLNSVRAFSASQPPPGSNTATGNYTSMDQWVTGVAGVANSTGAVGFTDNVAAWDPILATHAGVLQTANNVGPFFFNLNVLKAIGFTQAAGGGLLPIPNGLNDNFSAVDIGRWSAGMPGVITNTGTTGFVTSTNFTGGPPNDFRIGGLHTTTQVGGMPFDFNVLPSISLGPGGISFSLAPDMTAAPTPFAGITPPTPGVVQPGGGVPIPLAAPVSPLAVSSSAPAALVDDTETPKSDTSRVSTPKPTVVIPGVNGAPLAKPPTGTAGVTGGNPFNPLAPFTPITDAFTNGIGAITGARPGAAGGTDSSGAPSGAGTGGPSGGADSDGNGSGVG